MLGKCVTKEFGQPLQKGREGKGREGKGKSLSRVRLCVTPWTVAYQASQSKGFSRQEYWSGLPFPSPGDLPFVEIKCN